MTDDDHRLDPGAPTLVEGYAQVVAVADGIAWFEPEQTTSCGGCASANSCGAKGIGTVAARLEARRFALPNRDHLRVGERVVVGVSQRALVRASVTAYVIPLVSLLGAGILAQWAVGNDLITLGGMCVGLVGGLVATRRHAQRLANRGELTPRYLRRAETPVVCHF